MQIEHDGTVLHSILVLVKLYCDFAIENFPFDTQTCTLHFGSWSLDADQVRFVLYSLHFVLFLQLLLAASPVEDFVDGYIEHAGEHELFRPFD